MLVAVRLVRRCVARVVRVLERVCVSVSVAVCVAVWVVFVREQPLAVGAVPLRFGFGVRVPMFRDAAVRVGELVAFRGHRRIEKRHALFM